MNFSNVFRITKYRVIFVILLIAYFVLGLISKSIIGSMPEQLEAQRWSRDIRVSQISLFTTQEQYITEDNIKKFEYQLEKKLKDAGVTDTDDDDEQEKPRIIDTIGIDQMNTKAEDESDTVDPRIPVRTGVREMFDVAYCAQGLVTMSFEKRTAENCSAIGVGGDFFLFHPLTFVSGSWFSGEDLMKDRIVIDEDMAWKLFGSKDIVGESVLIAGVPHYITGVVKKEKDRINKASYQDRSYVYMSYDSLSKYGNILSGSTKDLGTEGDTQSKTGGINCIEVVCPNPVNGLAARLCKESLGVSDEYVTVIENTDRFSFISLLKIIGSFGTRSMWSKSIYYPYWENTARGYEDILAAILFLRIICAAIVIILLITTVVRVYRNKTWTTASVAAYIADKKYDLEVSYNKRKQSDDM